MHGTVPGRCCHADRCCVANGGAGSLTSAKASWAGQPRPSKHPATQCHASVTDAVSYKWEQPDIPRLTDAGELVEESRIKAHEVGANQRGSIITVSNLLQEAASNHIVTLRGRSQQYFAADPELAKLDLIFVILRMQIRMHEYPSWGDVVRVKTYFSMEGKQNSASIRARRDWVLTDATSGKHFGSATSSWALLNYKTRRLGKMPEDILHFYRQHMPAEEQRTIPVEETKLKLPASSEGMQCSTHTPSDVHTDMNDHVNNTAYLTWILDSIPDAVQETHMIAQYEVDYKAEARKGDALQVGSEAVQQPVTYPALDGAANTQQYITTITKDDEKKGSVEVIRARTTWGPIADNNSA